MTYATRVPARRANASSAPELVHDVGMKIIGGYVEKAATEPDQVAVADLGTDRDAASRRSAAHALHDRRIAGVKAARDVGTRDDVQERVVVAEHPPPEALAKIGVEIHASY